MSKVKQTSHRHWMGIRVLVGLALVGLIWLFLRVDSGQSTIPVDGYEVVNTYPHDPEAFTQGLVLVDGQLYEGTGQRGLSTLRKVDLTTGKVLEQVSLANDLFGEGITIWKDQIFQLTWQRGLALVYDKDTLKEMEQFRYKTEGWGLTHDGKHLIMSDGTETLRFRDPDTFEVVREVEVTANGKAVRDLNELEYIKGEVYANVWGTDRIARIDPRTGKVRRWLDLTNLLPSSQRRGSNGVLNGIAYDVQEDRLFVTGKNWPSLFEIRVVKKGGWW